MKWCAIIKKLSKATSWSFIEVSKWFWRARNHDKPSKSTKFKESFWRFTEYSVVSLFGLVVLVQEPLFSDMRIFFKAYPQAAPSRNISRYWLIQLAYYSSLLLSQFRDIKRKDFYAMSIHHLTTIGLLLAVYTINALQLGVIVLLIHDAADIPLELAKLLNYTKTKASTVVFSIFIFVFFITRLIIYPLWVLRVLLLHIPQYVGMFPALILMGTLCLTLLVLHVYWFKQIVMVFLRFIKNGEEKDVRSDSESSDYEDSCNKKD